MTLRLSGAPNVYSPEDQRKLRADLEAEDKRNFKRGEDVDIGRGRLLKTDPVTGARFELVIDGGDVTWVPVT